jgi:adenylate kinase
MLKTYIIFFGPPGSGKGTQAEKISEKKHLPIISTGALFRREIELKTALGRKIKPLLRQGQLVSDITVNKIFAKRLQDKDMDRGAICDGYPRNIEQQNFLITLLGKLTGKDDIIIAILVQVRDKTVIERLSGRRVCACGATYHIKNNPPPESGVCSRCGNKSIFIRDDDKEEVIRKRLKVYHQTTRPMLDYWEKHGKLLRINGELNITEVENEIDLMLKGIFGLE